MSTEISTILSDLEVLRQTFSSEKTFPVSWRLGQLEQLRLMVQQNRPQFMEAMQRDLRRSAFLGRFEIEACLSEIDVAVSGLKPSLTRRLLFGEKSWLSAEDRPVDYALHLTGSARVYRDPLGVVLIISPWNFPVALCLQPLVAAIAAGNCVVLKPSEVSEHTSALIARLVPRYLDHYAIRVVSGGVDVSTELLKQRFDHILYTGNGTVGKIVMRAAAEHLTPVTLELGGKSPTIVDQTADLDVAARRILWGRFFNCGQVCISPEYILVQKSIRDKLVTKLQSTLHEFFGSDPQSSKDYERIINDRHFCRVRDLLTEESHGGQIIAGGQSDRNDLYVAPTIIMEPRLDSKLMQDEIFGPILSVFAYDSLDDAIKFVKERPKPLALYVFSNDRRTQEEVLLRTSSGGACINECVMHFTVPSLGFGGVGPSGMGAYHGRKGFETFTHEKSVFHNATLDPLRQRYPGTYAPWLLDLYHVTKTKLAERLVLGTVPLVVAAAAASVLYTYLGDAK